MEAGVPSLSNSLHILSWNCAGWSTTYHFVKQYYGSLSNYLERHRADIFCVQEAKVTNDKLRRDPKSVGATEEGWDSFWASCKQTAKRGLMGYSGVAVWARKGLVRRADCSPFRHFDSWADDEGRCLVIWLEKFVLFNVYVPTSGSAYSRIPEKLRFLWALRKRMCKVRKESGLPVVLVGDLNVAFEKEDVFHLDRLVDVPLLRKLAEIEVCRQKGVGREVEPSVVEETAALIERQCEACSNPFGASLRKELEERVGGSQHRGPGAHGSCGGQREESIGANIEEGAPKLLRLLLPYSLIERLAKALPEVERMAEQLECVRVPPKNSKEGSGVIGARKDESFKGMVNGPRGKSQIGKTMDNDWEVNIRLRMRSLRVALGEHFEKAGGGRMREEAERERGGEEGGLFFEIEDELSVGRESGGEEVGVGDATVTVWRANVLSISHLSDFLRAAGCALSDEEKAQLAFASVVLHSDQQRAEGTVEGGKVGGICARSLTSSYFSPCIRSFVRTLIERDGMVDSYRHTRGYSEAERFTAWEQYTNKRYSNEGVRLDYCVIDGSLLPALRAGAPSGSGVMALMRGGSEREGGGGGEGKEGEDSWFKKWRAACAEGLMLSTAGKRWEAAPKDGGGMAEMVPQPLLDSQFGSPSTGLVYTPPRYSDHIGTGLVFEFEGGLQGCRLETDDPQTKAAQPHRQWKGITSFFKRAVPVSEGGGTSKSSPSPSPTPVELESNTATVLPSATDLGLRRNEDPWVTSGEVSACPPRASSSRLEAGPCVEREGVGREDSLNGGASPSPFSEVNAESQEEANGARGVSEAADDEKKVNAPKIISIEDDEPDELGEGGGIIGEGSFVGQNEGVREGSERNQMKRPREPYVSSSSSASSSSSFINGSAVQSRGDSSSSTTAFTDQHSQPAEPPKGPFEPSASASAPPPGKRLKGPICFSNALPPHVPSSGGKAGGGSSGQRGTRGASASQGGKGTKKTGSISASTAKQRGGAYNGNSIAKAKQPVQSRLTSFFNVGAGTKK
uniref:Endonuclease/exonuclease/phosphatase domain-containing protein n=1 Tax=Chromera velia CCMP2878 TaxID=1169474 RepID=A0A0G4I6Y3_9ALVE|eukprot:Cvel_11453.t1-p1 / transcript=Cvel_11453.t1 / gene=Cvel_11453 / organism=Chromera_velia_CCMP2878 / gene_product=DNA-(apurinic or apyrimidinic site) lyase, putative / transcript_product=DNA-(apurinic or apyrimidinic site) lyase, putative / location=Cvel_scaffold720:59568-62998(-) / protein_length=1020 / sequence_SO=supercontig / SO=protein_coding / is_pseudo=false